MEGNTYIDSFCQKINWKADITHATDTNARKFQAFSNTIGSLLVVALECLETVKLKEVFLASSAAVLSTHKNGFRTRKK